jgi:hypothetical protein
MRIRHSLLAAFGLAVAFTPLTATRAPAADALDLTKAQSC